jgi:3-hydroxyisobutyrate dehydrogenase-like beta-hydroxyacid dehydrogenase
MKIAFLGLGNMGSGIAARLVSAGHEVAVWNRTPEKAAPLVKAGATAAASPRQAAEGREAVLSMLADDAALLAVLHGDDGLLAGLPKGAVHVSMSTIAVSTADAVEKLHQDRGQGFVAAPVLGRPDAAAAGQLAVMCAGEETAAQAVRPLLEAVGSSFWPLGAPARRASVTKLACNFSLACMIETLGEAGALVSAYGVAPAELYSVMTGTLFAAPAYKTYSDIIANGRFTPAGFKAPLGLKDVRLALAAGEAEHTPLPLASLVRDHLIEVIANGGADQDWSALALGAFRRSGRAPAG